MKHEAIFTSMVRYGDNDAIARVFTRDLGRLSLFCRAAFKPSKKRGSLLQTPARGTVVINPKPTGLSNLTELDLGSYTQALASTLRGFALAAYGCEIVEAFLPEHEPNELLFDLLDSFLNRCAYSELTTGDIRQFEFKLLESCGLLGESELQITELNQMAAVFVRHLKNHKQTPLKSLAFFKQIGTK